MELTDEYLNALADSGENFLKMQGLERLLDDVLKPPTPPTSHDAGWEGGNTEWPKTPDFDGSL